MRLSLLLAALPVWGAAGTLDVSAAAASPAAAARAAAAPIVWHQASTAHFDIYYQADSPPQGLGTMLENIHARLVDMVGTLEPSLADQRDRLVLYADQPDYVASGFQPPPWSAGLALPRLHTFVLYEMPDAEAFRRVTAHEMTHLMFEKYFMEKRRMPMRWLDEGMAMLMEDEASDDVEDGRWWQAARAIMTPADVRPFDQFTKTAPGQRDAPAAVQAWYLQSYLMTRFLYEAGSDAQFQALCDALRSGAYVRKTLGKVYGLPDGPSFDKAWIAYADLGAQATAAASPEGQPALAPAWSSLQPAEFSGAPSGMFSLSNSRAAGVFSRAADDARAARGGGRRGRRGR